MGKQGHQVNVNSVRHLHKATKVPDTYARGQVTLEYFLLFLVVALVTLVSLATLDNDVATTFENLFTETAAKMPLDDGGPSLP